ncbi:response regulator [Azospirillum sp. YIM B02556]|uniref:histidine kinase n=1 Tax=Azospirillum endophyticum TaxID=2800326 RepID=A0ABS1F5K4_9PROT|nr:ATP-binding protein [Azospirillum endophyticum]MBK1838663.1 response regulator [Azospirillum endophyticum]
MREFILVLAPEGRDAEVIGSVLGEIGLATQPCSDMAALCRSLGDAATALILSESALTDAEPLSSWLDAQPPWSDLPIVILTSRRTRQAGRGRLAFFQTLGNVTLLDRPLHREALQSAVQAALRSRERQYRTRSHLDEITRATDRLEERVAERTQALQMEMADRRRAEAALLQAQKMEALGQLTGGVAHDFNNLLQGIVSCLAVLGPTVPDGTPRHLFEAANRSVERGARLTQSLLSFARRQTLMPEPTDIGDLLSGMSSLLERTLGGQIGVTIAAEPGLPAALIDRAQLESAILNLVINARDAMPTGGRLSLSTFVAEVGGDGEAGDPADKAAEPAAGTYVAIRVEDTGTGIDPSVLPHVFEPFFTTKPIDKGSGLGLSMVQGMATQSGGGIRIDSRPGAGTAITLYLPGVPAVAATPDHPGPAAETGDVDRDADRNGHTILLVEDDAIVRMGTMAVLESLGHRVIEADGGEEALGVLRDGTVIDALVTDFAMPGMNGAAVVRNARRLRPGIPALIVTGYADTPDFGEAVQLLRKPFSPRQIADCLAAMLPK